VGEHRDFKFGVQIAGPSLGMTNCP